MAPHQKQPLEVFYKKAVLKNFADFTRTFASMEVFGFDIQK